MMELKEWLNCFDEITESKLPAFKQHLIATKLSPHEIKTYGVLHTAFILFNGALSVNQERLYQFYLPAIGEGLNLAELVSQAQALQSTQLTESLELLEDKNLLLDFLLDVLVFARLDGGVSDEFKQVLNAFCHAQSLSSNCVDQVIYLSDCILGIEQSNKPELTDEFDSLLQNPIWAEFFANEVTQENIHNLTDGIWYLTRSFKHIEGNIAWHNAVVIFNHGCTLKHHNGELEIKSSKLVNPAISSINTAILMEQVKVNGIYILDDKVTAFKIKGKTSVAVSQSQFKTLGARTFWFDEPKSEALFEHVEFNQCGNRELLGGAVRFEEGVKFLNCEFNGGIAKVAGAIFGKHIRRHTIVSCKFIYNSSVIEWEEVYWGGDKKITNAGALYFEKPLDTTLERIYKSYIDNNISIYDLDEHCSSRYSLISNSTIHGVINYACRHNSDYEYCLDSDSQNAMGLTSQKAKNNQINSIKSYYELVGEEDAA